MGDNDERKLDGRKLDWRKLDERKPHERGGMKGLYEMNASWSILRKLRAESEKFGPSIHCWRELSQLLVESLVWVELANQF